MSIYSYKRGRKKISEIMGIIRESGDLCMFCGRKCYIDKMPHATVEHVKPSSKGGSNHYSNKRISCASCNFAKSSLSAADFEIELISLSVSVMEKYFKKEKIMEEEEKQAYLYGAEMAAEYSVEIGKTDLALMTPDEILTLSECFCKNYHSKFNELQNKANFC